VKFSETFSTKRFSVVLKFSILMLENNWTKKFVMYKKTYLNEEEIYKKIKEKERIERENIEREEYKRKRSMKEIKYILIEYEENSEKNIKTLIKNKYIIIKKEIEEELIQLLKKNEEIRIFLILMNNKEGLIVGKLNK
jgi:hypothetical protein